jgi:hypothetical protein
MTARTGWGLVAAALCLGIPGPAAAQVWIQDSDRPAIGLSVGRAAAALVDQAEGPMWNATFEVPAIPTWRLRGDLGHAHFQLGHDMIGSRYPERAKMTRLSMSFVRTDPRMRDQPVRLFAGAGPGVYLFSAADRPSVTRFGLNGLGGIEIDVRDRMKIVGEMRLDLLRSAYSASRSDAELYALQFSAVAGVRWTWRQRWSPVPTR